MNRYDQLTHEIAGRHCETLIEIGVWNGQRACQLATAAFQRSKAVRYFGFDLFEFLTDDILATELSKRPPSAAEVTEYLSEFQRSVRLRKRFWLRRDFQFELIQGYTQETLPRFLSTHDHIKADVVFIDGGHAIETIENDWNWCSRLVAPDGVIFLDDYYDNPVLTDRFGCNKLLDRVVSEGEWEVEILPQKDRTLQLGGIQIARCIRANVLPT